MGGVVGMCGRLCMVGDWNLKLNWDNCGVNVIPPNELKFNNNSCPFSIGTGIIVGSVSS